MKNVFLAFVLVIAVLLTVVPLANAQYFGKYCFKLDNYADTWVWRLGPLGDAYQISGHDTVYPSSMNGSGFISGSTFRGNALEADPSDGTYAIHAFSINLGTFTGSSTFTWFYNNGAVLVSLGAQGFHLVSCPADAGVMQGQEAGPRSRSR